MAKTSKKTATRKTKTATETVPTKAFSQSQTVGIRKTRLMQIAEDSGDSGLMNPRSIDPLVYMLAEMGEGAFGPSVIENCKNEIAMSASGFPKQKALGFLVDRMLRKYLAGAFKVEGKGEVSSRLAKMPMLNSASYIDYFLSVSTIERDAFRMTFAPAIEGFVKMVAGYETEQPYPVCTSIVQFFKVTKNPQGFEELMKEFCVLIKAKR